MGGMLYNWMDINWLSLNVLIGGLLPMPIRLFLIEYIQSVIAGIGMYYFLKIRYKIDENIILLASLCWSLFLINMTFWRVQDLSIIPLLLIVDCIIFNDWLIQNTPPPSDAILF